MESFGVLTFILSFIFACVFYWYYNIPRNLPPGPLGLPFVGSLPFLNKKPYLTFIELAKEYGNIFHIYMGSTLVVVLNDFESIKEAFIKQAEVFSGRIAEPHRKPPGEAYLGLVHNDGEYWRQHRRFLISNLKSNGVGKHALEPRIMNEIHHFISEIRKICEQPVQIKTFLNYSLLNNVLLLANNTRRNYDDDKLNNFIDCGNRYVTLVRSLLLSSFFPWITKIPGLKSITKVDEISRVHFQGVNAAKELVTVTNIDEDIDNTYVKAFMKERSRRLKQSEDVIFTESGLAQIARDLLLAGGETSANLLCWIMLYLTKYPQVQLKVQEEIDRTIGRDREVTFDDRLRTPYAEAIIMECQRIVSLAPLSLPHRNIRETSLLGYIIPKNTMVFPNLYAVHHDPTLWGDPENFRPERFIAANGRLFKPEYLIPFSLGKRTCAGEPLARMELYLYLVTFLQHFQLVPTGTQQNLEASNSGIRQPLCDTICVKQR